LIAQATPDTHANMGRPTDDEQLDRFMAALRHMGGAAIGNYALIDQLNWSEDEYWRIRDKALEKGLVVRGRGRGGSVSLVDETVHQPAAAAAAAAPRDRPRESDLYPACKRVLETGWREERGLQECHVEITAHQGSKATGGEWTRPDLSAVSMRTFTHWPGRYFDLWTFEIKPAWEFSVTGVFEAAAHSRSATHSYVAFHVPDLSEIADDLIERCVTEAQRFGVGLVIISDPRDFKTWDFRVDPVRHQPDPALIEQFVATQMSDEARAKLARWQKT
jgi:hypothetical protein